MKSKNQEDSLHERHESERRFHDEKYDEGDKYPKHYEVSPTVPIYRDMLVELGDLSGKKVLEIGCGEGWCTVDLCRAGAFVEAFDISEIAVDTARCTLARAGVEANCNLQVMAAEALEYPSETFDVVFGFAILHHLELETAIREVHRVLRPNSIAIFAEPLQGNPLLRLYRKMTPQYRTPDERPFYRSEFPNLFRDFSGIRHREYYLFGQAAFALLHLPGTFRVFSSVRNACWKIDRKLMKSFPITGNWAWYSLMVATK